jgi:hypothetical protein
MALGKVAVFLSEAECKAVRKAFAPQSGFSDSETEFASRAPLPAEVLLSGLEAEPTAFDLEGRMVFLSLYSALAHEDGRLPQPDVLERSKEHWEKLLARLRGVATRTYLLNVFRHVRESRTGGPHRDPSGLRAYIRRLNRMGDELTSGGDAVLVDIDRALASAGGRALHDDFRWSEHEGAEGAIAAATAAVVEAVNTFPPVRR